MNPRLLLLEDDPTSAEVLRAGLAALPARVDVAGTVAAARACALAGAHDAWLFDLNLPDGRGDALLAALRAEGLATPAIALSAGPAEAGGFARVLPKPIALEDLRGAVRELLATGRVMAAPDWDDAAGLAALGGEAAALESLRHLFLDELPAQRRAIREAIARDDAAAARSQLHRLKASCAFVGAPALLAAVRRLHQDPGDARALADFERLAGQLLATPA